MPEDSKKEATKAAPVAIDPDTYFPVENIDWWESTGQYISYRNL